MCLSIGMICHLSDNRSLSVIFILLSTILITRFFSQPFKIKGMAAWSSFFDALPYVMLILLCFLLIGDNGYAIYGLSALLLILIISLMARKLVPGKNINLSGINEYVIFGISSTILSAFITLVAMMPRALAPEFMGENAENLYLGMRMSLVLVLSYQFIAIKFYQKIYSFDETSINRVAQYFSVLILLLLLLGAAAVEYFGEPARIYLFSLVFTILWIMSSVYEIQVIKNKLVKKFLMISVLPVIMCLIALYVSIESSFLALSFLVMLLVCIAQYTSLIKGFTRNIKSLFLFGIVFVCGMVVFYNG